ncbi:MAG TPA: hypothetical protein VH012_00880 [Acidimicrobiales bacterium]|jgi:hypothetical protein|nr:hypothetical protein [Acidimicrobiales bacterium]
MPSERHRVHCRAPRRGLSYRFAVRCEDASLAAQADVVLAGLREPDAGAPIDHWYSLTTTPGGVGTFDVRRDEELLARDQRRGDALGWLVWDVNRSAAAASGQHLLFHAGALEADGIGVLLPGTSGSGKSTLTAGLTCADFGYLTDELVAFDLMTGDLLPYAKPITLKAGSFAVVPALDPARVLPPGTGPWSGTEWQVPVGGTTGRRVGRPCPPRLVVVPRYDAAAPTGLTPLSDTEAFLSLALHAVNLLPHGAAGTAAVAGVVAQSACYALTMSDLDEACALVQGLVDDVAAVVPHGAVDAG